MLEVLKANRLLNLKKQQLKLRKEALEAMCKGDLKAYYKNLEEANKLKQEFSETVNLEV